MVAGAEVDGPERRGEGGAQAPPSRLGHSRRGAADAAIVVVLLLLAAVGLGLFASRRRARVDSAEDAWRGAAQALALSKYEELVRPAPGRSLAAATGSTTREESAAELLPAAPGFDPPPLVVQWTVEPETEPAEDGALRLTIVVRAARTRDRVDPAPRILTRLVFVLPGGPS